MADILQSRRERRIRMWPIAVLRIYAGVFFAWHGLQKVGRDNFTDGMTGFLNGHLESGFAFYRTFVESVVLPNAPLFAWLVAWGELAVGIGLVLGLATRYAALTGAFLVVNFWLAKGQGPLDGQNQDVIWLVIMLVLALVPAGRVAGLDDSLGDRLRFLR